MERRGRSTTGGTSTRTDRRPIGATMRSVLKNYPMAGWVVAIVLMFAAAFLMYRQFTRGETRELTQDVTIRDAETGETWQMPRGAMEKELYMRPFPVDPNEGLENPNTHKKTG